MKRKLCRHPLTFLSTLVLAGGLVTAVVIAVTPVGPATGGAEDAKNDQKQNEPKDGDKSASLASLKALEERIQAAAKKVTPAVVAVESVRPPGAVVPKPYELAGSGVIITADGLILSQEHVSHRLERFGPKTSRQPGERVTVILHDGRRCKAEVLGADAGFDLSLLRLVEPAPYPHTPLDQNAAVKLGDGVLTVGHPMGYRPDRKGPVVRFAHVLCLTKEYILTDSRTVGGDSGGPLFDLDGRLVGIIRGPSFSAEFPRWLVQALKGAERQDFVVAYSCNALIHSRMDDMRRNKLLPSMNKPSGKRRGVTRRPRAFRCTVGPKGKRCGRPIATWSSRPGRALSRCCPSTARWRWEPSSAKKDGC